MLDTAIGLFQLRPLRRVRDLRGEAVAAGRVCDLVEVPIVQKKSRSAALPAHARFVCVQDGPIFRRPVR